MAITFWGFSDVQNYSRLFVLQKYGLRAMCGLRRTDSCKLLCKELKIQTLAGVERHVFK